MRLRKTEPLERKLRYIGQVSTPEGIDLFIADWEFELPRIELNIGFNAVYEFIINLYVQFNLHLDVELPFTVTVDGVEYNTYPLPPEFEKIEKARYGISKYGQAIYDPPEITKETIRKVIRDIRRKATCKDDTAWKQAGLALKKHIDLIVQKLKEHGVQEGYAEYLADIIALCEGKLINKAYWDFAVWDMSVWVDDEELTIRSPEDWISDKKLETIGVYENHWDFARWDYARWLEDDFTIPEAIPKINDVILDALIKGNGVIVQYGQPVLYPRVKFLRKTDETHWKGGNQQLRLQRIINEVKRILDECGIIGQFRKAYYNFAHELYYLYNRTRKAKSWKADVLTPDDIVDKYVNWGCDKNILLRIKAIVEGAV